MKNPFTDGLLGLTYFMGCADPLCASANLCRKYLHFYKAGTLQKSITVETALANYPVRSSVCSCDHVVRSPNPREGSDHNSKQVELYPAAIEPKDSCFCMALIMVNYAVLHTCLADTVIFCPVHMCRISKVTIYCPLFRPVTSSNI